VEDSCLSPILAMHLIKLGHFPAILMDHRKIQRPEILVEWHVNQIIIDVEKEAVFEVLRWFTVSYPVQSVLDDFHGFTVRCEHL